MDSRDKLNTYGEWVLLGTKPGHDGPPLAIDRELLAAAREAWPHVLAHVRGELFGKELGPERTALAADIWDRVLRSVAKTHQRNKGHQPPISDLESYLIGVFHHRFNRLLKKEQRRAETIELVSSALDLERFEAALDAEWAEQLERAIAVRQITDRMNPRAARTSTNLFCLLSIGFSSLADCVLTRNVPKNLAFHVSPFKWPHSGLRVS
jgi:DNA-directed RNA polymerase specialized sigma24 family protein